MDPKIAAYRSWSIGSLLDDEQKRNQYRFLVAYYKGEVVGTFHIKGVALDKGGSGKTRKVKFLLEETDESCNRILVEIINLLKESGSQKIKNARAFNLINEEVLRQFEIPFGKLKKTVSEERIPILDTQSILEKEPPNSGKGVTVKNQGRFWLRLSCKLYTFDSFRNPHVINTESFALLGSNGSFNFKLKGDKDGPMKVFLDFLPAEKVSELVKIISLFYNDPARAKYLLDNSKIRLGVHLNSCEIEFEAFRDKKLKNRFRHEVWSKEFLFCESGLLAAIIEIMAPQRYHQGN